jgi:hypothetical protein
METMTFATAKELKKEITSTFPNKVIDTINGKKSRLTEVSNKHVICEFNGYFSAPFVVTFK